MATAREQILHYRFGETAFVSSNLFSRKIWQNGKSNAISVSIWAEPHITHEMYAMRDYPYVYLLATNNTLFTCYGVETGESDETTPQKKPILN